MWKNITSWFCIICFLFISPGTATAGALICFGEDGHIALEYSQNGDCADSPLHEHSNENKSSEKHCGECVDVPVYERYLSSKEKKPFSYQSTSTDKYVVVAKLPKVLLPPRTILSQPKEYISPFPTDLLILKTIVLLI